MIDRHKQNIYILQRKHKLKKIKEEPYHVKEAKKRAANHKSAALTIPN